MFCVDRSTVTYRFSSLTFLAEI
uniref:Uncharacterized protein n=1 Tax=Anguilla anguilla TaxID=7936 RepID=A0A0E9VS89_ANGAN